MLQAIEDGRCHLMPGRAVRAKQTAKPGVGVPPPTGRNVRSSVRAWEHYGARNPRVKSWVGALFLARGAGNVLITDGAIARDA